MSTQLKLRRGTTTQHSTFTGAEGEITVDTTKDTVVVHDGATAGGFPLAKESGSALSPTSVTLSSGTANGVAYLNGSKVLTTGSALTFDGNELFINNNANALKVGGYDGYIYGSGGGTSKIMFSNANSDIAVVGQSSIRGFIGGSEKMRLTSTGLGIGTSSPSGKLTVKTGTNENLSVVTGGGGDLRLSALNDAADTTVQLSIQGSPLYFKGSGGVTNATILSSGNMGIGTTSPATLLDLRTSNGISAILRLGSSGSVSNSTVGTIEFYDADSDDAGIKSSISNVITGNVGPGGAQGGNLLFSTATSGATPTERMRLDSSGNLGLGVTPSAGSTLSRIEIGAAGNTVSANLNEIDISAGAYYNSGWKYGNSSYAPSCYQQTSGAHKWQTATSGTAGNAISWTQAMTLDDNGRYQLGTTSAIYISKATFAYSPTTDNGPFAADTRSFVINCGGFYHAGGRYNTAGAYRPFASWGGRKENTTDGNSAGYLAFYTNGNAADTTERMRIDSSGNVGIGTSSPGYKLVVAGQSTGANASLVGTNILVDTQFGLRQMGNVAGISGATYSAQLFSGPSGGALELFTATTTPLVFGTNATERMRIDSSGNLGIGTSSPINVSSYKFITIDANYGGGFLSRSGGTNKFAIYGVIDDGYYDATGNHVWRTGGAVSGTERMRIDSSGNVLIGTTTAGASKLVVADDSIQLNTAKTPASATATGTTGEIAWDANYIYVCVATDTWKRSAIATW